VISAILLRYVVTNLHQGACIEATHRRAALLAARLRIEPATPAALDCSWSYANRFNGRLLCYPRTDMNILLVEDSDEVSCITVEYLHELGHQVVAVPEAEKAIVQLKDIQFDAVMTDVRLPGMSGIELARALVKDYPRLPVVITSGYGALNVEFLLGERLPTVLMLPKPYDLPALERTLAEAAAIGQRV
jgi:CheY-like chemotaxis protein